MIREMQMSLSWAGKANVLFEKFRIETTSDYFMAALFIFFLAFTIEGIAFERHYTNVLRPKVKP